MPAGPLTCLLWGCQADPFIQLLAVLSNLIIICFIMTSNHILCVMDACCLCYLCIILLPQQLPAISTSLSFNCDIFSLVLFLLFESPIIHFLF